jgi:catechol 2,3-dioxygenase-like lactoylglutathione lyase family enzyme
MLATMSRAGLLNATERSLHHLALGSADVERLAAFYRELVGLREVARHADAQGELRSIWLDLGGAVLMIERTEQPARRVDGIGAGPFLLAFRVSPSERRQIEVTLEANGHAIEGRTPFTSYSRDVDGNRVAFSHHPDPSRPEPTHSPAGGDIG